MGIEPRSLIDAVATRPPSQGQLELNDENKGWLPKNLYLPISLLLFSTKPIFFGKRNKENRTRHSGREKMLFGAKVGHLICHDWRVFRCLTRIIITSLIIAINSRNLMMFLRYSPHPIVSLTDLIISGAYGAAHSGRFVVRRLQVASLSADGGTR